MSFTVKVLPSGTVLQADEGVSLFELLRDNGLSPESPCGGKGLCGKCRITVNGEEMLACKTAVDRDMEVIIPEKAKTEVLVSGAQTELEMDPAKEGPLLAFDIGTTTVVCYLLDGKTGAELAHASMLNPQQPYGADVISRIQAALSGELESQRDIIRKGMTELIEECCRSAGVSPESVGVISVVGNPCMQQLFMGILPENLAGVPFPPVLVKSELVSAADYLPVCPNALLAVVPDISGYVGADTVGCVVSTKMYEAEDEVLMVDIGTNGEMVLHSKGRLTACSTAAGPALEGAKIKFGMRGSPGAIDHVSYEDGEIKCTVIGDTEAVGICGSGLIDAVAVALKAGLINKGGRIQCKDEIDGQRFIRLTDKVYLTQEDIREVQLAKGAIAAGIRLMAEQLDIEISDIDRVLLAGAFGSFMNPDSACTIGLLPSELSGKVIAVGNAAGAGSKMIACSRGELDRCEEIIKKTEFIELAALPQFQMTFAMGMYFKDPDDDDD